MEPKQVLKQIWGQKAIAAHKQKIRNVVVAKKSSFDDDFREVYVSHRNFLYLLYKFQILWREVGNKL